MGDRFVLAPNIEIFYLLVVHIVQVSINNNIFLQVAL
jgi:hypothetical protein